MKKVLIITLSIIGIVIISLIGLRMYTKSHSPAETVTYGESLSVTYCRPFKNEREIFGDLIPYDEVWRTGANEATVFAVNQDITFGGKELKAGKYSLWTIPGEQSWSVILNTETGQWGVGMGGTPNRQPENDILTVEVPVINPGKVFEQFTITFENVSEGIELVLVWDKTMIAIPIQLK